MCFFEAYSRTDAAEIEALVDRCFDSEDYKEGRTAFLEKRTPISTDAENEHP
ncbi:hypothetical protein D9M72_430550 [compost metagenome]